MDTADRPQILNTPDVIINPYRFAAAGGSSLLTDLVAWWALEEDTTADRVDSHSNGYNLTASGSIAQGTGRVGSGCDFESSDSRNLSRADSSMANWVKGGTNPLSINFWFDAESRLGGFISQGTELIIRTGTATNFEFILNSFTTNDRVSSASSSFSLSWVMVTCIYRSGGDLEIWIDGSLSNSVTPTGSWADNTSDFLVGNFATSYCDGIMDELAIWNKALTSGEISELYNGGSGITYSDL